MSSYYRRANEWLENRPAAWFVLAATVPGSVYVVAQLWLDGRSLASAAPSGAAFGVTFAVVTLLGRRVLGN